MVAPYSGVTDSALSEETISPLPHFSLPNLPIVTLQKLSNNIQKSDYDVPQFSRPSPSCLSFPLPVASDKRAPVNKCEPFDSEPHISPVNSRFPRCYSRSQYKRLFPAKFADAIDSPHVYSSLAEIPTQVEIQR